MGSGVRQASNEMVGVGGKQGDGEGMVGQAVGRELLVGRV